jgi:hypothetical protein
MSNVTALARLVNSERCGTLVLPVTGLLLQDEAVLELLDQIEIPVLLVR